MTTIVDFKSIREAKEKFAQIPKKRPELIDRETPTEELQEQWERS